MAGIEAFSKQMRGAVIGMDDEKDERELLSSIEGIKLFSVPDDPDWTKVVMPSLMQVTAEQKEAVLTVITMLRDFDQRCKDTVHHIAHTEQVPIDLRIASIAASIKQTEVLGAIMHMLTLIAAADTMEAIMPTELLRASHILQEPPPSGVTTLGGDHHDD